ncbi:oxidoreductase [Glycomyces terrestris]|uniref:SDR family NAD(P)-dependent oxidoreductase n=1 Tax=Glycomyces terrestris TaxID=2493553 RepID=A0A426UYZ6_9ACTN|nr:oxidoreductase [Glycomyces terrestris]RRR99784.1 SDR family NAD(P)-dependent oxidoreductase [Glycomyces terrestris]
MSTQPTRTAAGRVWLVTGSSAGFGRAITEAAVAAGDTVVATARRPEALDDLAAAHPGRVVPVQLDVTDPDRVQAVVAEALLWYGRIDVLVNNAGRGHLGAVEETTDAELRSLMDLHVFGPANLVRAALPHMRARRSGAIVQLSSMGGRTSFPGVGAYSATKFALEGLSVALAAEVRPHGVDVLIVEPSAFRTSFAGGVHSESAPVAGYEETVGPFRASFAASDGNQPGDPAKAAAAILEALAAEEVPLRLALGGTAVDRIRESLKEQEAELDAWEHVSRATDFDR